MLGVCGFLTAVSIIPEILSDASQNASWFQGSITHCFVDINPWQGVCHRAVMAMTAFESFEMQELRS